MYTNIGWRPASTQSPETRSTLSARCRDDTVVRWLSYAFDTAGDTGTFAWHTLHSTSPFISVAAAATGSPKTRGSNQRDEPGERREQGTLAAGWRVDHGSSRGPRRSRFGASRRRRWARRGRWRAEKCKYKYSDGISHENERGKGLSLHKSPRLLRTFTKFTGRSILT
uniref:Uncharacterized protein n=1 Tax=Arundo donax TaxID=35708 RepID=A0A0A9D422_ARUDO